MTEIGELLHEKYAGTDVMQDVKQVYKKQIIMKLGKKVNQEQEDEVEDPFKVFGHGIVSYFRMMQLMMVLFVIMTLIFIPVMYYYY